MLDIKFVRDNSELVKENLRKRGMPEKVPHVSALLQVEYSF